MSAYPKGHSPSPSQTSFKVPEANNQNGGTKHDGDSPVTVSSPSPRRSTQSESRIRSMPIHRSNLSISASIDYKNGDMVRSSPSISEVILKEKVEITKIVFDISEERLTRMPRPGSDWDLVLSFAQVFALQVWAMGQKLKAFDQGKGDSVSTASVALSACQVLLALGYEQARVLLPIFTALRDYSTLLSDIGRIQDLEHLPQAIQEHASGTFGDLVDLVHNIAAQYHRKFAGLKAGETVVISFDALFREDVELIWRSKDALSNRIWAFKLGDRVFPMTFVELRWKLQCSSTSRAITRNRLYDEVDDHLERSEESCHWFRDVISQSFAGTEQVLCVTGSQSSGKSTLVDWVKERLERPIDGRSYSVITYDFAYDSPQEATTVAFLKNILFNLLEQCVGNVQLYERIMRAFEGHPAGDYEDADEKIEPALWAALHDCLGVVNRRPGDASLVLVLDHCDGIIGHAPNADEFFHALQKCVAKLPHVRVMAFCQKAPAGLSQFRYFQVTDVEVRADIKAYLYDMLCQSPHFNEMGNDGGVLIDALVEKAKGHWLWTFYVGRIMFRQRSKAAIANTSKELTSDVSEILNKVVEQLDLKNNNVLKILLSFMLVIERPLAVYELAQLLDIEENATMPPTPFNVSKFISENCDDIIIVKDGKVRFRTNAVRSHLRTYLGTSLLSEKEANKQLLIKLLLFAKYALAEDKEPSVDELGSDFVHSIFSQYTLVGYAVRCWIKHFKLSGFVESEAAERLHKEFGHAFPSCVIFALLEKYCWSRMAVRDDRDLMGYHQLALGMRKACFGERHLVVVQTFINLGLTAQIDILESDNVGATYFYEAVKIGKEVLPETSFVLEDCMTIFLERTDTIILTKRTQIVSFREEIIQLLIQFYRRKDGSSSDQVIQWYKTLAQLYIDIGEEHNATVMFQELYKVTVTRYGPTSAEAKDVGSFFATLSIVLLGQSTQEIGDLEELIYNTSKELNVADPVSIKMWIRLAQSYVACGSLLLAEQIYVRLWDSITAVSSSTVGDAGSVQVHIAKIQVILEFVKFLRELKRTEEASNILICLCAEYEHQEIESEEMLHWIREIGLVCRTMGLLSIAATVLNKVWSMFKLKGRAIEAQRTTVILTELVGEIHTAETAVVKSTTSVTSTTTTTEVSETIITEVYEHQLARCQETGIDRHLFSACWSLVGMYTQKDQWYKAEEILKRTLGLSWTETLSPDAKIKLCEHSVDDNLVTARRLANCYSQQGHFEKAEKLHLKIFSACFEGLPLEDARSTEAVVALIHFYEGNHRHNEVIGIRSQVLQRYRKDLGPKHKLTIQCLYALAEHCKMVGREEFALHYLEIVTVMNKDITYCHPDAVNAALILCGHYRARRQWADVQKICFAMWETIQSHRKECAGLEEASITLVFEAYKQSLLELDPKVGFTILYKLSVQYKETIAAVCGLESVFMIKALTAVAEVCERSEDHHYESAAIYEEVLKKTTQTKTTTETISIKTITQTIKTRLSRIYVAIFTTGKAAPSGTAAIDVNRSIQICTEHYEHVKAEYGCWHEKSLIELRNVVILQQRANTKESRTAAFKLLQDCAKEILTVTTVNITLFTSASTLASIFFSAALVAEGQTLLSQMRKLIIFRGQLPTDGFTIDLESKNSKILFIFLIAFEHGLGGPKSSYSYSQGMSQVAHESVLYEDYSRVIEGESKIEVVLQSAARLRNFWAARARVELLKLLDQRVFPLFQKEFTHCFKGIPVEDVLVFYLCLLVELAKDRPATSMDFEALACKAGNDKVKELLVAREFHKANQLSCCIFSFAEKLRSYHNRNRIPFGYQLAELLAGIGVPHPSSDVKEEAAIQTAMMNTSKSIMRDVITAFSSIKIEFISLRLEDLDGLIRLLSLQHNFDELEILLSQLWQSREALHKSFGCDHAAVIEIGYYLIHTRFAQGRMAVAIDTAKVILYNMSRAVGSLDPETLKMARLVGSLFIKANKPGNAMAVHDGVLREIASACDKEQPEKEKSAEGASPKAVDHEYLKSEAETHLELLLGAHHLLEGWTRPPHDIVDLINHLNKNLGCPNVPFDQWVKGSKNARRGDYEPPKTWTIENIIKLRNVKHTDSRERLMLVGRVMREYGVESPS